MQSRLVITAAAAKEAAPATKAAVAVAPAKDTKIDEFDLNAR